MNDAASEEAEPCQSRVAFHTSAVQRYVIVSWKPTVSFAAWRPLKCWIPCRIRERASSKSVDDLQTKWAIRICAAWVHCSKGRTPVWKSFKNWASASISTSRDRLTLESDSILLEKEYVIVFFVEEGPVIDCVPVLNGWNRRTNSPDSRPIGVSLCRVHLTSIGSYLMTERDCDLALRKR